MSRLTVSGLVAPVTQILVTSGHTVQSNGMVVQVQFKRSDLRTSYSAPTTGNGTTISELAISITPKFSNSLLLMRWMINGESSNNAVYLIHDGGSLITTAGYQGYNKQSGNSAWSGVASAPYDLNDDSTPSNMFLQYAIVSGSTATRTFAPAIRSSGASATNLFLNRTVASTGADAYETMVSTGVIMEIAQ